MVQRQRNILHLISQYLIDFGLKRSQATLVEEENLTHEYRVCDNIDLDTIYLDYCSYFQLRFGKAPKVLKRNELLNNAEQNNVKTKSIKNATTKQQRLPDNRATTNLSRENEKSLESISLADMISVSSITNGETNISVDVRDTFTSSSSSTTCNGMDMQWQKRINFLENLTPEMKDLASAIEQFVSS